MNETYDLVVAGAGSGGIAAAVAAARAGLKVLLYEKRPVLGGNAAWAGVNMWETGVGGTGLPLEVYRRLKQIPRAVGLYSIGRHGSFTPPGQRVFPGGESVIDPSLKYADTLQRHGTNGAADPEAAKRAMFHGVVFEPEAYVSVVTDLLAETGRCTVRTGVTALHARAGDAGVESLDLSDGRTVSAGAFVDATADVVLARLAGCPTRLGREGRETFDEPSAAEPEETLNAATLIYRVSPAATPRVEPLPDDVPAACWWRETFPWMSMTHYPCGDRNINMLPTIEGRTHRVLGDRGARQECRRRIRAHWHWLQTEWSEFRRFRLRWIAPELGVREGPRAITRYVLTEHDLRAGLDRQQRPGPEGMGHDDIIAIADHARDRHGAGGGARELDAPVGIPYRCLLPEGRPNLLVACRGAGFSSIAASSCRLSRTMMQLGQAAGVAAAVAAESGVAPAEADPQAVRAELARLHVQLDFPMTDDLRAHLAADGDA